MKHLNQFITEYIIKKKLENPIDSEHNYKYFPATRQELFKITQELIDKGQYDLNCINTERITDMSNLFVKAPDIDISQWDVSNVKDMRYMFVDCENFNCDLSNWDVSKVENMSHIFFKCEKFEGKGLENWDVHKVKNMNDMFYECKNFNCDLSNWDVSNVENMEGMFNKCGNFKGKGLDKWNVNSVKITEFMFIKCDKFDCDLSNWNVSNIENMQNMFQDCKNFKGKGLEKWNLSNVKYMSSIFKNCEKFDCDVSNWNIRNAIYMDYAFINCLSFTGKGLDKWNPQSLKDSEGIFDNCKSIKKYPKWYTDWFK